MLHSGFEVDVVDFGSRGGTKKDNTHTHKHSHNCASAHNKTQIAMFSHLHATGENFAETLNHNAQTHMKRARTRANIHIADANMCTPKLVCSFILFIFRNECCVCVCEVVWISEQRVGPNEWCVLTGGREDGFDLNVITRVDAKFMWKR